MPQSFSPQQQIVLASGNQGKIKEIQAILAPHPILAQSHFNVPEAEETATTFIENALIKARNAALHCQLPALADDSGLVVDALNGAPGVISARYAGVGSSDQDNVQKLLTELAGVPEAERTARFMCVIVFMRHAEDPVPLIAQGVWEGRILTAAIGTHGFGYDPVFWIPSHHCTSAELSATLKNTLSHRAQALQQLKHLLLTA
ncbi:MAG: RdgB/HAM1 family non-canonical purine NTP pyrophosphatase [Methylococcaceae bacterium]|nr:RdgB/HAM1 family non-canonical purine NTP pyrophosphatase [Methylococcaceae bacterium]